MCRPRRLSFSAADRLVAMENLEVLQRNGFEVAVSEDGRGTTEELVLVAQPVSKSTVFDMMGTSISHSRFLCSVVVPSQICTDMLCVMLGIERFRGTSLPPP